MDSGHEAKKPVPTWCVCSAHFFSLVTILARVHKVSMIWMYVFMFKLVLSFCVELGPWPLTGNHSKNLRNRLKQPLCVPSVFPFVKESCKKQDEC